MALPQSFSYALRLFPHPWFRLRLSLWLLGASALFLVLYSANVLLEPPDGVSLTIEVLLDVIWAFYAIDYVLTMYVAEHSWRWLGGHIFGFIILLLPLLPGMRFARIVAVAYAIHTGVRGWVRGPQPVYHRRVRAGHLHGRHGRARGGAHRPRSAHHLVSRCPVVLSLIHI